MGEGGGIVQWIMFSIRTQQSKILGFFRLKIAAEVSQRNWYLEEWTAEA